MRKLVTFFAILATVMALYLGSVQFPSSEVIAKVTSTCTFSKGTTTCTDVKGSKGTETSHKGNIGSNGNQKTATTCKVTGPTHSC
jgi:hypothetical protein